MFIVYAIKSKIDSTIYVGMTSNLENRINEHNKGRVKSTKSKCPWKLIFQKTYSTREEARKWEKYYKSGCGKEILKNLYKK